MIRWIATKLVLLAAVSGLLLGAAAAASAQVEPYGTNDYGGFRDVLPPGTNGLDTSQQLLEWEANHNNRPPHNDDQLAMYSNLTTAAGGITENTISDYYKDSTFGVKPGDIASSESPEPGVTIIRDKQFGVPHIYGNTRAELMFGIGYATAEDRLFFIDVLRHSGQADLASFAGGANVSMDEGVWANEPYTPQDLVNQVNYIASRPGGAQVIADAQSYVNGINAYIAKAQQPLNLLSMMPAEYALLGQQLKPFTVENLVSIATLVGGIFGNGGGDQLSNAVLYEGLTSHFGNERYVVDGSPRVIVTKKKKVKKKKKKRRHHRHHSPRKPASHHHKHKRPKPKKKKKKKARIDDSGFASLLSLDAPNDPGAPTTVQKTRFPYQTLPKPTKAVVKTIALPDPGTVHYVNPIVAGAAPSAARGASSSKRTHGPRMGVGLGPAANAGPGLLAFPRGMSNALLVSAKDSASGHPLAVMGPQVAYFAPQILMEEDIHGPGVDAAGAAFPGVNLYVELGHGPDYAWSATSSGQNIIDTFAVPLCNPSGGTVATSSDYYVLHGQCVQMQTLTDSESWTPNAGDQTAPGSVTFQTERTAYGIVIARAMAAGRPVVYTNLRSTYMHELDSAAGFEQFNEPSAIHDAKDFFNAADKIGYTFNWFYADNKHIGYFNSGLNPVRAPNTDPLFPTWSQYAWKGLNPSAQVTPASLTEQSTPESAHPHVIDQGILTSWNNKQAPGYGDPATGEEFSSVDRSQLLDNNLAYQRHIHGGKLSLANVINAMGVAGTQDLRGIEVLPYALKIIGTPSNPALANAVAELRAWTNSGAHRINREHPGATGDYDQTNAVRIMDAWWPLLVKAEFQPLLGPALLKEVEGEFPVNDEPGHGTSGAHLGSSWDVGFYGVVQTDLRDALHQRVAGPLNRTYCGSGVRSACRAALESSLSQAIAETPDQVYPSDGACSAGDQMCSDSIQFRAIGGISQPLIEWINRPTFQQADEILGHRPG